MSFRNVLVRSLRPVVCSRIAATRVAPTLLRGISPVATRGFSVTSQRFGNGVVDKDLAHSLQTEISYEAENEETEAPEFLKEFQDKNTFQIEETSGQAEVTLTRKFGNETIQAVFSITDINNAEEDMMDEEEEGEEPAELPFPVRCNISITKGDDNGCFTIDAIAEDGAFGIESVIFYKDAKLARDRTSEADWNRRGYYVGPNFNNLDEGVKENIQKYLEERGFDEYLANFIPDYIEYKEQKEYLNWLKDVKTFVEK
ncbi:mitochondrial glyco protein [Basidiobolus meristosporus CBS 931.73]|uniref:Mitochondrial glyco protein n=1 Tax=Basidiobolus meristosporus CBS 931.73 TaxID=1314790 RepID=A0A1Y1YQD9_9FUNG|nr:mitochondrial glyco protein [Basidiobolus meristosporus CBS 931.73]|eukprot:ORY00199.1 mitochondrial glyco protein [Basidiobolus meristosporus CBS 931.73]